MLTDLAHAETVPPQGADAFCGGPTHCPHTPHTTPTLLSTRSSLLAVGVSCNPHIPHEKIASKGGTGGAAVGDEPSLLLRLEAQREAFVERAAILEYDAGMSREEAEKLARALTGWSGL